MVTARAAALLLVTVIAACDSAEERAQKHLERGLALMEAGDPARASLEFRNAIKLNDRLPEPHVELAGILLESGNVRGAISNLLRALDLDPELQHAHESLGRIMLAAGELDTALEHSEQALRLAPDDPGAMALRAALALRLGDLEQARELARSAVDAAPEDIDALIVQASLELQEGRHGAAIGVLDTALAVDERNISVNLMRVVALERIGATEQIGAVLRRLVDFYPEDQPLRSALARWLLEQGDPDAAIAQMRELAGMAPDVTVAALDLVGFIAEAKGPEAARNELERLIAEAGTPGERITYETAMASDIAARGERDRAKEVLRDAIASAADSPDSNLARVALARVLFAEGDFAAAWQLVDEAIALDPIDPEVLTQRGRLLIREGRYGEAIADLRSGLGVAPEDTGILLLLAEAHERSGNRDLARERLGAAVETSGFATVPVIGYARFLLSEGREEFAEAVVARAVAERPENARLLQMLASIQLRRQNWIGAEETARRLSALETAGGSGDERPVASGILAAAMRGQSRFDESIEILNAAVAGKELSRSTMAVLVQTYMLAGQSVAAKAFLERVIGADPTNPWPWVLLAAVRQTEGDGDDVDEAYRMALAADPSQAEAYVYYSRHLLADGRPEEAREIARAGAERVPESGEIRLSLSLSLEAVGEADAAIAELERLHAAYPDSPVIANNLASLIAESRRDPKSIERAFELVEPLADHQVPEFRDTLGWILHLRGEHETAVGHLESAARALRDNPLVQYHLGMAYAAAGIPDAAVPQLERAILLLDAAADPRVETARRALEKAQSARAER